MADPRIEKLAKLLVNYSVAVQPGDKVLINTNINTKPLLLETYREVLRAGGHPFVFWQEDELTEIMLKEGNDEQLQTIPEPYKMVYETYDCLISLRGSSNTRSLNNVDPSRQQLQTVAGTKLTETFMKRSASGELRWVGTLFPTQAHAQDADMSLSEFEDFVYGACHVDKEDPVAEWNKIHNIQQKLVDWLVGKKAVKVAGPNIEMTLNIDGRTFVNSDGHHNMPSGEIFTGPVEDSANGWVRFTYPAIYQGREVEGIELRFKDGKVVEATAKKNEDFLQKILATDEGARFLGEFAVGTNHGIQQFTKSILFDEKIGGTLHMAVGAGYPETGSVNKSGVHWDMICDMRDGGKIWIDDELFYDSGEFTILK